MTPDEARREIVDAILHCVRGVVEDVDKHADPVPNAQAAKLLAGALVGVDEFGHLAVLERMDLGTR